jgi:ANTAR domain
MTSKRSRRVKAARSRAVSPADAAETIPASAVTEPGDSAASATAVSTDGGAVVTGSVINTSATSGTPVTAFVPDNAVVRRTKDGWRVGSDDLPDLTCAMILADLLAAESGVPDAPHAKPPCEATPASEAGKLRATVGQLEHALATRIRVEQAIGVLAERHRIKPRQAFEQLREAARSRGRKVIDIAGDVVASATNPLLQLPDELSRPRSGPRRGAHQPSGAQ